MGGGTTTETVVQSGSVQNQLPEWVQREGEELFQQTKPATQRPAPTVDAESRIAPFGADQAAAFDIARANVGNYGPAYGLAFGGAGASAAPITAEQIRAYSNPYAQDVIDTTSTEMWRQNQRDLISRHGAMAQRGSYLNEDRRGVLDNLANESTQRMIAEMSARERSNAFNVGLGAAGQDKARLAGAAGQYGSLAQMIQQLGAGDVAQLGAIGGEQQGQEQQLRNIGYEEFIKNFYYPQEQANYLTGLLQGIPYNTSQITSGTGQQLVPQDNTFGQIAGGVMSAAALASMFMPSSKDFKTNKRPVIDILPDEVTIKDAPETPVLDRLAKLPVEAWQYLPEFGDPHTHVGPYAEDWKEQFGLGDGKTIAVVDAFGIGTKALQELKAKVDGLEMAHAS